MGRRHTGDATDSGLLPPIGFDAAAGPTTYAAAFIVELFTRDYATISRDDLLAWVQAEDSPLRVPDYPVRDWTKVLVDSLADPTWDGADPTAVPPIDTWQQLNFERARQEVSDLRVTTDPYWEHIVAGGYRPPDPAATERDASFTITLHAELDGRPIVQVFSASLQLQLGMSAAHPGYGIAATNNYVVGQVS